MFQVKELDNGSKIENEHFCAFFGNRNFEINHFEKYEPNAKFVNLKQIHSDILVQASTSNVQEADAHWTKDVRLALGIFTADCVPILIVDTQKQIVLAMHAGWRGLYEEILIKSVKALNFSTSTSTSTAISTSAFAFVGPHIRTTDFEISYELEEKFLQRCKKYPLALNSYTLNHKTDTNKRYLDLTQIVKAQFYFLGFNDTHLWISDKNTFQDLNYQSFRRDKGQGRQISFIYKK